MIGWLSGGRVVWAESIDHCDRCWTRRSVKNVRVSTSESASATGSCPM